MDKFDSIVIGGGSGLSISSDLAERGEKVALIEEGPMGGTCLNRGCIPSKMVIHSADVMEIVKNSGKFGIRIDGKISVNFKEIIKRTSRIIDEDAKSIEEGIRENKNIALFKERGKFIGERQLQAGERKIEGEKIYIIAGSREFIPKIPGLENSGYITSTEALRLKEQPKSLVIIGGGFIAAEMAHFFGALGTKVTILQRSSPLLKKEDLEIANKFTEIFSKKYNIILGWNTENVEKNGGSFKIHITGSGKKKVLESEQLLIATGRVPNTDILEVGKCGVKLDKKGFIEVNKFMETSVKNVWAAGDIVGKYLFKHSANLEAAYALHNSLNPKNKVAVDYTGMPHAVFSSPQISSFGKTEEELKQEKVKYLVGRHYYKNTGMGAALQEENGFVKIIVEKSTNQILGCHILGPEAPTLIHEVLTVVKGCRGDVSVLNKTIHIHPALSEVVQRAVWNLEDPG